MRHLCNTIKISFIVFNFFGLGLLPVTGQNTKNYTVTNQAEASSRSLVFVENEGQFDEGALFLMQTSNGGLWISEDAIWFTFLEKNFSESGTWQGMKNYVDKDVNQQTRAVNFRIRFIGSNPSPRIEPFSKVETPISYFIGNQPGEWHPAVALWEGVRYSDLYPGIDLVIEGDASQKHAPQPRWYLDIRSGGDPNQVKLQIEGPHNINIAGDIIRLENDNKRFQIPLIRLNYEKNISNRLQIAKVYHPEIIELGESNFVVSSPISLKTDPRRVLGQVNENKLSYSTFLGGSLNDSGSDIVVDETGAAYVVGTTQSFDFPVSPGAVASDFTGENVFVTKVAPNGGSLDYAAVIGGQNKDTGEGIAVVNGLAYLTGYTLSPDFPSIKAERYYYDAFVIVLNQDGTSIINGKALGGSSTDYSYDIALDQRGIYITGETLSQDFAAGYKGNGDAFVVMLNYDFQVQSNYPVLIGGNQFDIGNDISVMNGELFVTGQTRSYENFPEGGYQGNGDAFVAKLNPDGTLAFAKPFGGNGEDNGAAITVDLNGFSYVAGTTNSSSFTAVQNVYKGMQDAFISQFDQSGTPVQARYLGGAGSDEGNDISLGSDNLVFITGVTNSPDFPITYEAIQTEIAGSDDAFVVMVDLNSQSKEIFYGSYMGGSETESANALALDLDGAVYLTGGTNSSNFPVTSGAYSKSKNGGQDAFFAKALLFSHSAAPSPTATIPPSEVITSSTPLSNLETPTDDFPEGTFTPVVILTPTPVGFGTSGLPTITASQPPNPTTLPAPDITTTSLPPDQTGSPAAEPTTTITEKYFGLAKASPTYSSETDKNNGDVKNLRDIPGRDTSYQTATSYFLRILYLGIGFGIVVFYGFIVLKILVMVIALVYFTREKY
jgi:hypothetical protein